MTESRYTEAYYRETYGTRGLQRFSSHWWSVRWYAGMADACLRRTGGRRVLEIGCGHGFTLARLEERYETWGVDISDYAIREAAHFAPRSRCVVADVDQGFPTTLTPGSFDLVMAKYVFEHLRDPALALRRAAALLRPGGTLFISMPYTGSLGARVKGDDWYARKDPTHCSLLDRDTWLELLRAAGLSLYRESADGWWDVPYVRGIPTWLQLPVVIGPTALACLSGRALLPPRWGENLLFFASKPAASRPDASKPA